MVYPQSPRRRRRQRGRGFFLPIVASLIASAVGSQLGKGRGRGGGGGGGGGRRRNSKGRGRSDREEKEIGYGTIHVEVLNIMLQNTHVRDLKRKF